MKAEITCTRCGYVLKRNILDENSEWRTFGADISATGANTDRNRVGGVDSDIKEEMGASTILTGMNGDMAN